MSLDVPAPPLAQAIHATQAARVSAPIVADDFILTSGRRCSSGRFHARPLIPEATARRLAATAVPGGYLYSRYQRVPRNHQHPSWTNRKLAMLTPYSLLQAAEVHITASGVATEYAGFLAYFGIFGALGFRWLVLRRTAARQPEIGATGGPVALSLQSAEIGAARIGIIGAFFMLLNLLMILSARASEKGISFGSAIAAGGGRTVTAFLFVAVFLVSFA